MTNCVAIDGDYCGNLLLAGAGAGGKATASAVASDILDIARGDSPPPFGVPAAKLKPYKRAKLGQHQGAYYVRLSVYDRPGAMAGIAGAWASARCRWRASCSGGHPARRSASPRGPSPARRRSVILITHETTEEAIRGALAAIAKDGNVSERPQMIRIEPL